MEYLPTFLSLAAAASYEQSRLLFPTATIVLTTFVMRADQRAKELIKGKR